LKKPILVRGQRRSNSGFEVRDARTAALRLETGRSLIIRSIVEEIEQGARKG